MLLHRILRRLIGVRVRGISSNPPLSVSSEVSQAVTLGKPVVALESAFLSHGMPAPENFSTAVEIQDIISELGAVPAITAVIDGALRVGLSVPEIERLCYGDSNQLFKVSRRDLAPSVARGLTGGTTVSGSMLLAHLSGIKLLVTGGIGGVHIGGEGTMDISADLIELGRTPVTVVCAGAKSILDIERTCEVLETQGVTVCTLGGDQIPGFFSTHSGVKTPIRVDSISEITDIMYANHQLELSSGIVVCVPMPEAESMDKQEIDTSLRNAMQSAEDKGIHGNELSPYLLQFVKENTQRRSLEANMTLLKNNARVGAQISKSLSMIPKRHMHTHSDRNERRPEGREASRPVVIGGINFDIVLRFRDNEIASLSTNAGWIKHSLGGVGRNIAQCLKQVGSGCEFISVVGRDAFGQMILKEMPDPRHVRELSGVSTAKYCVLLNGQGELLYGVGDMDIHKLITPRMIDECSQLISKSPLVTFDGNLSYETLVHIMGICAREGVPTWFEPTCRASSTKFISPTPHPAQLYPSVASPNRQELVTMHGAIFAPGSELTTLHPDYQTAVELCTDLLRHIPVVIVTLGEEGVVLALRHRDMLHSTQLLALLSSESRNPFALIPEQFVTYHFPAVPVSNVTSVSGAGDCLAGTVIAGLVEGASLEAAISSGILAASLSLQSKDTVPDNLTSQVLTNCTRATILGL